MAEAATRHLTVLLTDIKGFTTKTAHKSRSEIAAMLTEHGDLVLPVLQARGGRLVKSIGDAFLMTFDSPTDAVLAGVAVQAELARHNAGLAPERHIEIRVAVNAGEVNVIGGDIFGDAVNITARVEAVAEANEVTFTEAVYLAMNKSEVPSDELGLVQLKGVPEKVRLYKVRDVAALAKRLPAGLSSASRATEPIPAAKAAKQAAAAARRLAEKAYASTRARMAVALVFDAALCGVLLLGLGEAFPPQVTEEQVLLPPRREATGDELIRALGNAVGNIRGKKPTPAPKPEPRYATVRRVEDRTPKAVGAGLLIALLYWLMSRYALGGATPGQLAFVGRAAKP